MVSKDGDQLLAVNETGKIIAKLIKAHGTKLLDDRRKLLGLLRDYAPAEVRGVKLLMAAHDQGTSQAFADNGSSPSRLMIDQQVNALVSSTGLQADMARWAVESWSAGLYGSVAKASAAAATAPTPADDLTWGSEVVGTAPLAMAPSATAAPGIAVAPGASAYAAPAAKAPINYLRIFMLVCAAIVLLVTAIGFIDKMSRREQVVVNTPKTEPTQPDQPATPPQQPDQPATPPEQPDQPATPPQQPDEPAPPPPQPDEPAPPPKKQAGEPAQDNGKSYTVTSTSEDWNQWPVFAGGSHPGNVPGSWKFNFNSLLSDGRIVVYEINVALGANMKSGAGFIRSADLGDPGKKAAYSGSVPVVREYKSTGKYFSTLISNVAWEQNEPGVPPICVAFTSGSSAKKFQPEGGFFCVNEVVNGVCSANIGCGRVN